MRFGIYVPNFGDYGDPTTLVTLAREAEEAGWDGVFPTKQTFEVMTAGELREVVTYVRSHRPSDTPFDFVLAGETPGDDPARAAAVVAPYAGAGLTWWQEALHGVRGPFEAMRERVRQGPPAL